MSRIRRLLLTATLALAPLTAALAQTPPDPCAPSQYAGDDFKIEPAFPGQTHAPAAAASKGFALTTVASGLNRPRSLAFLGKGRMLVSEGGGKLRIIEADGKLSAPIAGTPETLPGVAYDIALDRGFSRNRTLYLVYRAPKPGEVVPEGQRPVGLGRVVRAQLSADGESLQDVKIIHEGGFMRRIVQAPDGTLLFTTTGAFGDVAQSLGSVEGKVLRINADGSIPKDNPFLTTAGAKPEIFSLGHRDPDGIFIDPADGRIWLSEHGPRGGDEINIVQRGKNYGYPTITYGHDYSGAIMSGGRTVQDGLEQPIYWWNPDPALANLLVYRGGMFPDWKGDVFVTTLVGKSVQRLVIKNDRVVGEESMLTGRCQRYRDIRQAADGSLYVLTDGEGASVLRIARTR